jgi:hypothetical protein
MKSDKNFEKKLPEIAAFEAREPEPEFHTARLEAIEDLAVLTVVESGDVDRFEHVTTSSRLERERERQAVTRKTHTRRISREFEDRLNAMGWP